MRSGLVLYPPGYRVLSSNISKTHEFSKFLDKRSQIIYPSNVVSSAVDDTYNVDRPDLRLDGFLLKRVSLLQGSHKEIVKKWQTKKKLEP